MNETVIDIEIKNAFKSGVLDFAEVEKFLERGNAKTIRQCFCKMTDKGGAVMNPIVLAHFAFEYLQEHQPNQNNKSLARNLAYLYSCLCNEYCLSYRYKTVQENDFFYMPQWKWHDKYMLGGKVQKQVKLLEKMGWIYCCIKKFSQPPYKREFYAISIVKLIQMCANCKNFQSEKLLEYRENEPSEKFIGFFEKMENIKGLIKKNREQKSFEG